MSQHANVCDGGTSIDGVSRACLNKLVGMHYQEGMRKPARNGNPGELEPSCSRLARHFLKARWRDPDDQEDLMVLQQMFAVMHRHEVDNCVAVLREFCKWRPGPAGRGDDRFNVRPAHVAGLDTVDEVLRNVRRRIEASRAQEERLFDADDADDCDDDDAVSMRSTVVGAPISRPKAQMPVRQPDEPVDKVQALHGLIQEIRKNNMGWAANGSAVARSSSGASAHSSAHPASAASSQSLSSADLLNNLFRQVAAQTASISQQPMLSSQAMVSPPMLSGPVASSRSFVSSQPMLAMPAAKHPAPATLAMGSVAKGSPFLGSTPSRDDISNASSAHVQRLCASFGVGPSASGSGSLAGGQSLLSSIKLPSSTCGLTLPPLKHVIQASLE
jgi:hypothetical protein